MDDQGVEQVVDFVAGQRNQPCGWAVVGAFGGGEYGEVGEGEHR